MEAFYVKDENILSNCIQAIKEAMPITVVLKEKKRSLNQNALMWKWLTIIADHTGYTKEVLHDKLRLQYLPTRILQVNGKIYELPKSTTELTVKEFSEYMDKIQLVAMELELALPQPEYYGY